MKKIIKWIVAIIVITLISGLFVSENSVFFAQTNMPADGTYKATLTMEGGTGKASIESPLEITVKDGQGMAKLKWSSSHYDYMIVGDQKYLNESAPGEKSTFTIPVQSFDKAMLVMADTTAMSTPHEIQYMLTFHLEEDKNPWLYIGISLSVILIAAVIAISLFFVGASKEKPER